MSGQGKRSCSSRFKSSNGASIVRDLGVLSFPCSYCKSASAGFETSVSHLVWTNSLSVGDYQDLLARGWNRGNGRMLEFPEPRRTCCPSQMIRLRVDEFVPSKDQIQVNRRMERFLQGTYIHRPITENPSTTIGGDSNSVETIQGASEVEDLSTDADLSTNAVDAKLSAATKNIACKIDSAVMACVKSGDLPSNVCLPSAEVRKLTARMKILKGLPEDLKYTSNISFQIAAAILKKRTEDQKKVQLETMRSGEEDEVSAIEIAKKLASKLQFEMLNTEQSKGFHVQACNGHLNFVIAPGKQFEMDSEANSAADEERSTLKLRKTGISASEIAKEFNNTRDMNSRPGKKHKLEIRMRRPEFDPEAFEIYKKYQVHVHKENSKDVTKEAYVGFLIKTPLHFVPPEKGNDGVPPCGFGTFHQEYLIDGKLVAVGVLDILPKCVSSHYLFYDPDYAFLSLGKYAALHEILDVQHTQKHHCPSMKYYYLGDYIHSSSKLRYKAEFRPSELLCRLSYRWIPFEVAKPLLDDLQPISSLAHAGDDSRRDSGGSEKEDDEDDYNVNAVLMMLPDEISGNAAADFEEYAKKVGPRLSRRITYVPNEKHFSSYFQIRKRNKRVAGIRR